MTRAPRAVAVCDRRGVARLVMAHPIAPGRGAEHVAWCAEVRARRDELAASRQRVGITRHIVWTHVSTELAMVRVDADDPVASLRELAASDDPFDRWYAAQECALHGAPLLADGVVPEVLADHADGEPDDLDMFIAVGLLLRPGRTAAFRLNVAASVASGTVSELLQLWDVRRLTIWLHPTARGDVVIYEAAGDVSEMIRSLAESDHPRIVAQRASILDRFGLDLSRESWPIPLPGVSWSSSPS